MSFIASFTEAYHGYSRMGFTIRFSEGEIHVYAVIDLRRDPEFIRRHLDKSQILKTQQIGRGRNELNANALTRTSPFVATTLFDDFSARKFNPRWL